MRSVHATGASHKSGQACAIGLHPANARSVRRVPSSARSTHSDLTNVVVAEPGTVMKTDVQEAEVLAATPAKKPVPLKLNSFVCYRPHPEKEHYGGEDAHFVSEHHGGALGVADGVGGWADSGVNPADYSRSLMSISRDFLEGKGKFEEESKSRETGFLIDPKGAMHVAHMGTKLPGSATCCVMQLDADNSALVAANLGDSGFMVLRNGAVLAKSRPLQHYFDCPLQFGAFPEFVEATDTAEQAELYNIPVLPGDVIIAGSDGLWDNVFESELIELGPKSAADLQDAANRLCARAREHAGDDDFMSPYTNEALAQGLDMPFYEKLLGMSFKDGRLQLASLSGGKMDDITVIVSMVEAQPSDS